MAAAGDEHFRRELVVVVDLRRSRESVPSRSSPTSSSRPTNGLTKVAPAFAASSACAAENTSVTLTRMPSSDSVLQAWMPSRVSGTLTTMCSSMLRDVVSLAHHAGEFGRTTSPLTGPFTMAQIFLRFCAVVARFLRQQRRVGGHAVDDADARKRLDVLDAAGVYEQLHESSLCTRPIAGFRSLAASARRAIVLVTRVAEFADPSTRTLTTSPATIGPTPDGVPVEMMSPGSSVMTNVMYSIRNSIGKIRLRRAR